MTPLTEPTAACSAYSPTPTSVQICGSLSSIKPIDSAYRVLSCFAAFGTRHGRACKLGNSQDKTQRRKKKKGVRPVCAQEAAIGARSESFGEKERAKCRALTPCGSKDRDNRPGSLVSGQKKKELWRTGGKDEKKRTNRQITNRKEVGNAGSPHGTDRIIFF